MAIAKLNSELAKQEIEVQKSKDFKPQVIEVELPEADLYVGTATGEYKIIHYTNASGKGLLILACLTISRDGKTIEVDVPISESKVGMFNDKQEVNFSVTRKTPNDLKRVKFLAVAEETPVNS